jgi:DNA-directed RNA polymerase subunit E'
MGKETKRTLMTGDAVRVRITAASLGRGTSGKIGVTARQPFLGKLEWIEKEIEQITRKGEEKEKELEKEEKTNEGG